MPLPATQPRSRSSWSSSKPNRWRTAVRPARSSTWDAVTRAVPSSSRWESTSSRELVWRSERSASRTRSLAAGCGASSSAPSENAAAISGANVSTSGHMTRTSRGSRVGSSLSRPRMTSRRTSTSLVRPWQAWTWTLRSSASSDGGSSRTASSARSCLRWPSRVSGCGGDGWWMSWASGACSAEQQLQLEQVAGHATRAAGCAACSAWCRRARRVTSGRVGRAPRALGRGG